MRRALPAVAAGHRTMVRRSHAVLSACLALTLWGTARGQMAPARTVKLKLQAGGRAGSTYTPAKITDRGRRFRFGEPYGRIQVAGKEILVAGRYVGDGFMLGVDCNGDGKVLGSEWARLNLLTRAARFLLRLSGDGDRRDYALRFVDVAVGVRANQAVNLRGRYMVDGCMAGVLDGVSVGLFDDNMDGQYTQDGEDAIVIGASPGAMPLWKHHQVGKQHGLLDVASDGGQLTFQPVEHKDLGMVDVPVRSSLLRCLMLVDDQHGRAYDVKVSGKTGIPAGNYELSYAVLASGKRMIVAGPSAKSLVYTVSADSLNVLRFGPPCRLVFGAYYHHRDKQIRIRTDIIPYGIGGERYYLEFAGYHPLGENPHVVFTNGRRDLTNSHMLYDSQNILQEVAEWVPAGFTRKTGKIVVTCELPILGKAVGVRTLADVLDAKKPEPPDPKRPAVATKKLPEGVVLGQPPPPKPRPKPIPPVAPPPPRPRPRPQTRPTKPRVEDPEYDAAYMLDMAKAFLKQGKRDKGISLLKEVVRKYPKTVAAKKADEMLLDIEIEEESQ